MSTHLISIDNDPVAMAQITAALIRSDKRMNRNEPPAPGVRFVQDKPGQDKWLTPKELNREGQGDCSSIVRAAGGFVGQYVGVARVQGGYHAFLVKSAPTSVSNALAVDPVTGKPYVDVASVSVGSNVKVDANNRIVSNLTYANIIDPCVEHGMNNRKMPPLAYYQHAYASLIWYGKGGNAGPPQLTSGKERLAVEDFNTGYQARRAPTTSAGRAVARVIDTAAQAIGLRPRPPSPRPSVSDPDFDAFTSAVTDIATTPGRAIAGTVRGAPSSEDIVVATRQIRSFLPRMADDIHRIAASIESALANDSAPQNDAFLTTLDALSNYGLAPDLLSTLLGPGASYSGYSGGGVDMYGNDDPNALPDFGLGPY